MKSPYLNVTLSEAEKEECDQYLKPGWGRVGSKLKGCTDETRIRKLLAHEVETRARPIMIGNLLGRLRSLERKRIVAELMKRRHPCAS